MIITFIRTWILSRLRAWAKPAARTPVIGALSDLTRSRSALIAENLLLRQQLIIVERQIKRPKRTWWDRVDCFPPVGATSPVRPGFGMKIEAWNAPNKRQIVPLCRTFALECYIRRATLPFL